MWSFNRSKGELARLASYEVRDELVRNSIFGSSSGCQMPRLPLRESGVDSDSR